MTPEMKHNLKRGSKWSAWCLLLVFTACADVAADTLEPQALREVTYEASNENFPNLKRGHPDTVDPYWPEDKDGDPIAWDDLPWDFYGDGNNFSAYNYTDWTPALKLAELEPTVKRACRWS